jgi:hypothetical protein
LIGRDLDRNVVVALQRLGTLVNWALLKVTNPTGSALSKQSSPALSTLAARVLQGYQPTHEEARSLAASVLSQDTTKGQSKGRKVKVLAIIEDEDDGA